MPSVVELCAGAGGQALGLEQAGFEAAALVELDNWSCETLRTNRPGWDRVIHEGDVRDFRARGFDGVDLVAAGLPCPPFSLAGKQLGEKDERNLFPEALRVVRECRPRAVMIENVRGILEAAFDGFRARLARSLSRLGYKGEWRLLNASAFGVPQLRPRAVFVAFRNGAGEAFTWPEPEAEPPPTVGEALRDLMGAAGWERADAWARQADSVAPTLVGGSRKHGGPDLGPTRAREAWKKLGVDGKGLADEPPPRKHRGMPRLTVPMTARLQGFSDDWKIAGRKTPAYRQVGNAFPPPVARAVAERIRQALDGATGANGNGTNGNGVQGSGR